MVAEHGMLRGTLAANAAALEDTMATAAATVATVAVAGDALTLGAAACRRRLQRVRGDEDEQDEAAQDSASATPTRQLDFTGTATGSRAATETSPAAMSTVEEFMDTSLGGPAQAEAPQETEAAVQPEESTAQEGPAAVPASEEVMTVPGPHPLWWVQRT